MKNIIAVASLAAIALIVGVVLAVSHPKTASIQDDKSAKNQSTTQEKKTVTPDTTDLKITDEVVGTGAEATTGSTISVNYLGTLLDGTKFDSSYDRNQPFEFKLGAGQVIEGWDKGFAGMKVGGKRKLVIPSSLGYGASGVGSIPANSTLVFEVELLAVK
ncbi:MAG: FKBP-type peptidyl-prolyl cis-trans isomerase [Candidatus Saccharibacteria bacterium]